MLEANKKQDGGIQKFLYLFVVFTNSFALSLVFLYYQRTQFHYISEYLIECFRVPK